MNALDTSAWLMLGGALFLVGAALGFLLAKVRSARRIEELRVELETARVRLESETVSAGRLQSTFESLAGQTLRDNSEMFLRMARESLGRDQVVAQTSLKERETAIASLLEPLRVALEKTEAQAQSLERERRDAYATLRTQIETLTEGHSTLQRETRNLVTALRRPEVRGRWGELTLRRLVELAGMSEHCDFTEQLQVASGEDGGSSLRPDLVVHMPDDRDLVVDVKTPLDAFLEALEATTEEARALQLKRHAQHLETRIRQLASKNYWSQFEHSPEFAVLFLPGDQFLSAALAERPDLIETALKQNVIIATPSTLIALLKTVAYGWRQSAVAQNAVVIRELGQELYRRLGTFTGHLGRAGNRLGAAVEAYNAAVGSLERQVLPQARRFTDLGVTADAPLAALESVDSLARVPAGASPEPAGLGSASAEDPLVLGTSPAGAALGSGAVAGPNGAAGSNARGGSNAVAGSNIATGSSTVAGSIAAGESNAAGGPNPAGGSGPAPAALRAAGGRTSAGGRRSRAEPMAARDSFARSSDDVGQEEFSLELTPASDDGHGSAAGSSGSGDSRDP